MSRMRSKSKMRFRPRSKSRARSRSRSSARSLVRSMQRIAKRQAIIEVAKRDPVYLAEAENESNGLSFTYKECFPNNTVPFNGPSTTPVKDYYTRMTWFPHYLFLNNIVPII